MEVTDDAAEDPATLTLTKRQARKPPYWLTDGPRPRMFTSPVAGVCVCVFGVRV
jgi:hypothetical protein